MKLFLVIKSLIIFSLSRIAAAFSAGKFCFGRIAFALLIAAGSLIIFFQRWLAG